MGFLVLGFVVFGSKAPTPSPGSMRQRVCRRSSRVALGFGSLAAGPCLQPQSFWKTRLPALVRTSGVVVLLASSPAPRSVRHSERKPSNSNPRSHSCRLAAGMRSSRFTMMASRAMRRIELQHDAVPGFRLSHGIRRHAVIKSPGPDVGPEKDTLYPGESPTTSCGRFCLRDRCVGHCPIQHA